MTITFNALSASVPSLKQAAKELSIDLISGLPEGEYTELHVIIQDYYQLVLLGTIAGMNSTYTSLKNPLNQIIDTVERKLDKIEKKKNSNNDNQLG